MRIVEDKDGERFLEIENKEDFRKFKEDLLRMAKEKMKTVKKGEDTFVEFSDFNEVREVFEEAIKEIEEEEKANALNLLMRPNLPNENYTIFELTLKVSLYLQ